MDHVIYPGSEDQQPEKRMLSQETKTLETK